MKVLSLNQPFTDALFIPHVAGDGKAVKDWETRGWKQSKENQYIIRRDGMLIHSSKTAQPAFNNMYPFSKYCKKPPVMGAIIGFVRVGRIITTTDWLKEFSGSSPQAIANEKAGDYSPNRWAWEFTE